MRRTPILTVLALAGLGTSSIFAQTTKPATTQPATSSTYKTSHSKHHKKTSHTTSKTPTKPQK